MVKDFVFLLRWLEIKYVLIGYKCHSRIYNKVQVDRYSFSEFLIQIWCMCNIFLPIMHLLGFIILIALKCESKHTPTLHPDILSHPIIAI